MQEGKPASKKGWLIKAGVLGAVVLAAVVLALRGVDFRMLSDRMIVFIRDAGPWVFFGAMAVLPVVIPRF